RLNRDEAGRLVGYQRGVLSRHVRNIAEYLNSDDVLFPSSIILALSTDVRFTANQNRYPGDDLSATGTIEIPLPTNGVKTAWIVDGQQRAMALSQSSR